MANGLRRCHLGWVLFSSALLFAAPIACSANGTPLTVTQEDVSGLQSQDIQPLLNADVVYLGERHDSTADHAAQMEIIEAIYAADPDIAIALEMFQRPFQPVIDLYLAGEISEGELVAQTEYKERWGFPWEYYAPFLRFAQANQIPVLALNAPGEVVSQIARQGLDSLEGDDLRYIPPLDEIDTSNTDYQAFVASVFGSHGGHGEFNFDNFFAAQVTWDETMAATVADFKQTSPDTLVIVLAGNAHVMYGYGIPDRVARRLGDSVQQTKVLLNFPEELLEGSSEDIADILWYSE
ncbi:MAG: ChaN family lipoprotein [Cyanobacteria bacterium P01_F01_bin.86]